MQLNYGQPQLEAILTKLRMFNENIGDYELFAITNTFDYVVKLSNGRILIKLEDLQNDEKNILTSDNLKEISKRFVSNAPNQNTSAESHSKPAKSKTSRYVFIGLAIIAVIICLATLSNTGGGNTSYYEKVMSIEEIERATPTDFLSADGTYRENFWGNKFNISCVIKNKATVASYKDAVVRVTYYSKTKTVLGENDHIIYEVFKPSSEKKIEFKADNYDNVHSIGWEVVSAIPN